jgi:hypothetical protein
MLIQSCRIHGRFSKSLGECRPAKAQSASRPGNPSKLVLGRYDDRMIPPAATKEKEIGIRAKATAFLLSDLWVMRKTISNFNNLQDAVCPQTL